MTFCTVNLKSWPLMNKHSLVRLIFNLCTTYKSSLPGLQSLSVNMWAVNFILVFVYIFYQMSRWLLEAKRLVWGSPNHVDTAYWLQRLFFSTLIVLSFTKVKSVLEYNIEQEIVIWYNGIFKTDSESCPPSIAFKRFILRNVTLPLCEEKYTRTHCLLLLYYNI